MDKNKLNKDRIEEIIQFQDRRKLTQFQIDTIERNSRRNWDIFYKCNATKFFKDRHWTIREFPELFTVLEEANVKLKQLKISNETEEELKLDKYTSKITLLEAGCGVGNFIFPIIQEYPSIFIYACDFSSRAIEFVRSNPDYNEHNISLFAADLTEDNCFNANDSLISRKADFSSLIFVLSSINPAKQENVIKNLSSVMNTHGIVFFRDYGRYDVAQLRFKPGKKISDNYYVRKDGTKSYFFTPEEVITLFTKNNEYTCLECTCVYRQTVNIKEQIDVQRTFVQGKFKKL